MPPNEVFLSHSSRDEEMAQRLAEVLHLHGVPTFFSPRNIAGADKWHDTIGAALERCDWFPVLLSPDAVNSMWVKRELNYALIEPRYDGRILPIHYKQCDFKTLSWVLSQFQFVDISGEFADGCRELLKVWGIRLRQDATE